MSKKVIEQKEDYDVIVSEDKNCVYIEQKEGLNNNLICIVLENRTTVAKAIDPEYQKVIDELEFLRAEHPVNIAIRNENKTLKDQNAKLVEALEELVELRIRKLKHGKDFIYCDRQPKAWEQAELLIQQSKNIEG